MELISKHNGDRVDKTISFNKWSDFYAFMDEFSYPVYEVTFNSKQIRTKVKIDNTIFTVIYESKLGLYLGRVSSEAYYVFEGDQVLELPPRYQWRANNDFHETDEDIESVFSTPYQGFYHLSYKRDGLVYFAIWKDKKPGKGKLEIKTYY